MLKCSLCEKKAITTAAHIPVCLEHWNEYKAEAEKYLPMSERKFYMRLLASEKDTLMPKKA